VLIFTHFASWGEKLATYLSGRTGIPIACYHGGLSRGARDRLVSEFPELLNISLRGKVGELRLRSAKFLDQPGVLAEVTGVLANARINIIEMITGLTDISVFISFDDVEKAETLLKRVLEHYAG